MVLVKKSSAKSTTRKKGGRSRVASKDEIRNKIDRRVSELEHDVYGLKELIHGFLVGIVIGFIIALMFV